jgi:hypothetical protein
VIETGRRRYVRFISDSDTAPELLHALRLFEQRGSYESARRLRASNEIGADLGK